MEVGVTVWGVGWEPGVSSHLRAPVFALKLEGRSPRSRVKQRKPPSRWRRAHQRAPRKNSNEAFAVLRPAQPAVFSGPGFSSTALD